jgi:hypothetical protein
LPAAWRPAVIERDAQGRLQINRITYEICALQALREQLRCTLRRLPASEPCRPSQTAISPSGWTASSRCLRRMPRV